MTKLCRHMQTYADMSLAWMGFPVLGWPLALKFVKYACGCDAVQGRRYILLHLVNRQD